MPNYSIKDLENLTGIHSHTIRIWEQRYKLLNPERTPTNIRIYSEKELRKLLSIALLNKNGLKISKIAKLSDFEIAEALLHMSEVDDTSIESQIERLKLIMVDLNEPRFEKLFSHIVLQMGLEDAILKVFMPFFKKLTFLWQTNSVTAAQINFITSLYRQKMYVAIDGLLPLERANSKNFIMFLPKTELLDNGLLFCNYMAQKRGFRTLYLGVSFPAEELPEILEKNPGSILVSVATLAQTDLTAYYTGILSKCGESQTLLLTGNQADTVKIVDPRLTVFQEYVEFKNFLENL